jgi:hypothetical protein
MIQCSACQGCDHEVQRSVIVKGVRIVIVKVVEASRMDWSGLLRLVVSWLVLLYHPSSTYRRCTRTGRSRISRRKGR